MKRDLLTLKNLNKEDVHSLINRGLELKKQGRQVTRSLVGYTLGLIFEKASTRTRVSFETAMFRLGGQTLFLSSNDTQLSRDETIADTARVLSRYIDVLAIRTYSQELVEEMAEWADIPIINALTDLYHPCQVLSDLMTIQEKKGSIDNWKVAWIGDGNNVAHSWIQAASIMGFELILACPERYHPSREIMDGVGPNVRVVHDPKEAVTSAHIINTDVWASMGQEAERDQRISDFRGYQVDESLIKLADPNVLVMHCLPAHRGEEISAGVMDGTHSIVFDQAENKMHLHMALLEWLLGA
jgi:ornithine carbamoyltransferase